MKIKELSNKYYLLSMASEEVPKEIEKLFSELMYNTLPSNLYKKRYKEILSTFYTQNKSKIDSLVNKFKSPPKYLGSGVDGVAFDIGDGLVLKLYTSSSIYNKYIEAMDLLHTSPEIARTEIMIYDVGEIGRIHYLYFSKNVYYTILQKIVPISILETTINIRDVIALIAKQINNKEFQSKYNLHEFEIFFKNKKLHSKIIQSLKPIINEIKSNVISQYDQIDEVSDQFRLKSNWLDILIEEILIKFISDRKDLHTGNLGVTNSGEFRYFDPAAEFQIQDIWIGHGPSNQKTI